MRQHFRENLIPIASYIAPKVSAEYLKVVSSLQDDPLSSQAVPWFWELTYSMVLYRNDDYVSIVDLPRHMISGGQFSSHTIPHPIHPQTTCVGVLSGIMATYMPRLVVALLPFATFPPSVSIVFHCKDQLGRGIDLCTAFAEKHNDGC